MIGGTNLFSIADSIAGYTAYGTGSIIESTPSHLAMQSIIPIGTHKQLVYQVWNPSLIINTVNTNRLVFFKADGSFLSLFDVPQLDGTPYQKSLITVPDTAAYVRLAAIVGLHDAPRDKNLKVKFEFGNKPTDWTPSDGDVQSSLNANANAIQTTNAEVSRINGEVTSQASSISLLQSSLSEVDTKANTAINNAATAQQTANTAVTKADATALIAQNLQASLDNTNAKLSTDYYTKASTDQAIASATNQLSSSFDTAIKGVGVIKDTRYDNQPPSWYWTNHPHRVEREFKYSYNLGIPQATVDMLGVLETAVPWNDSSGGPIQQRFTWVDSAYALTRYSISDNEWSVWASALNEIKKTVDRKLDASIISNYYTKAEADNVVAGKVEQFSSTIAVGGANLWSIINATRISEQGSHSVRVNREEEEEVWVTVDSLTGDASLIRFDSCLVDQNTPFIEGEDVVLSFEVSSSGYNRLGTVYAYVGNVYSAIFNANLVLDPRIWQRVVHKFKASSGGGVNGPSQLFGFHLLSADGWNVGTALSIRHVQLQRGNTATAFSRSPALTRATIKETTQSINGIEAVKTVTIDNNGVMSGYGLISELKNGQVTSSFGVNADTFYIGSPNNNKKPFIHRNDWSVINGVWVPPGTYIDTALIANATISNAQVGDLSADKITAGNIAADRMKANIVSAMSGQFTELSAITAKIGVLRTATSGARTEIRDNLIEVYDSAGRVRVRMGVF